MASRRADCALGSTPTMSEEPEAQGELEFFIATLTFGVLLILCVLCRIPDAKQAPKMPQNLRKQKTRKKLDDLDHLIEEAPTAARKEDPVALQAIIEEMSLRLGMSFETVQSYWKSFEMYDVDGSGTVSHTELAKVLEDSIGFCPSDAELQRILRDTDTDGSGALDFAVFCTLAAQIDLGEQTDEELNDAFLVWSEGKEKIEGSKIRVALTTLGDKLTQKELDDFMAEADTSKDGFINRDEFVRAMRWGKDDVSA